MQGNLVTVWKFYIFPLLILKKISKASSWPLEIFNLFLMPLRKFHLHFPVYPFRKFCQQEWINGTPTNKNSKIQSELLPLWCEQNDAKDCKQECSCLKKSLKEKVSGHQMEQKVSGYLFRKFWSTSWSCSGRRGGLVVSAPNSGASGSGSSPGRGHCVVFLGKTLHFHGASLHPGV